LFNGKITKWDNVFEAMIEHSKSLRDENRHGYASSFESTIRAIKEFHEGKKYKFNDRRDKVSQRTEIYLSGKKLYFHDITPTWLEKFEKFLEKEGKSRSTIGIYMRNLRVIFNLVIKKHRVRAEYPFKEYQPKTSTGRKRALSAMDISRIANYKTEHPQEIFYRDIFWFSFLANGMNLADIARLKYSNIDDDELVFVRQKTKWKEDEEFINVPITKDMKTIIDLHGNRYIGHDAYIFPILKPGMDEREIYSSGKQFTKMLNKYIGQIAENLKIGKITSYAARHSWATIAKNNKTPTEYIKEQLGHSNVSVTERYLKSFEKTTRKKNSQDMEDNIKSQTAGKN